MGKTPKMKNRAPSAHSRASRRATSPSIDTDKSLKNVKAPEDILQPDDILAARHGSGVSKKQKQKPLTRQQRLRKEKGIARAEAVVDQLEVKVGKSKDSARNIKNRAATWEDLNTGKDKKKVAKKNPPNKDSAPQDDAMEDVVADGSASKAAAASALVTEPMDDVNEIT